MYKVKINHNEYAIKKNGSELEVNGKFFASDLVLLGNNKFHLLHDLKSYTIEIVAINNEEKIVQLKVNNIFYECTVQDKWDELLQQMGMDKGSSQKGGDIKAPMPGLVVNVLVQPGQQISKGDALLVLEAMKMENILKSPGDGEVKKVLVSKGEKVEKNQVMVSLG